MININKLKYLLNNFDMDVDEFIYDVLPDSKLSSKYSAVEIAIIINCYILVSCKLNENLPYSNIKEFFKFNAFTNREYGAFRRQLKNDINYQCFKNFTLNIESFKLLLNFIEYNIKLLVDNVLNDSETDPHYSAVAATNRIKCYVQIMSELGEPIPYNNVREFFEFHSYSFEEYNKFEESRQIESQYYRGIQY